MRIDGILAECKDWENVSYNTRAVQPEKYRFAGENPQTGDNAKNQTC